MSCRPRTRRRLRRPLAAAGAAFAAAALLARCRGPGDFVLYRPPSSVSVSPADTSIVEGTSFQLHATVLDARGDSVPAGVRTFRSGDTAVLRVTANGLVTGVGAGQSVVTVDAENLEASARVTVGDSGNLARVGVWGQPYDIAIGRGTAYVTALWGAVFPIDLGTLVVGPAAHGPFWTPVAVAFDSAGLLAYVSNGDAAHVAVVDPAANAQVDSIITSGGSMSVGVLGGALFVGTTSGFVFRIDLATHRTTDSIAVPGVAYHLLEDRAGGVVFAAAYQGGLASGGTIVEADGDSLTPIRSIIVGGQPQAMALSPDRQKLYVANWTEPYLVGISLPLGAATDTIPLDAPAIGLAISADGTRLYAGLPAGAVEVIDRATGARVRSVALGGQPREVRYDAARARVLVTNVGGWVDVLKP
ncbi:MAG TPA: Ig-like domain-containing protein [Gemmatimonadales bacterium]|nr:Ig-like domain-containing protein [Gemmatimonadales bacterium]